MGWPRVREEAPCSVSFCHAPGLCHTVTTRSCAELCALRAVHRATAGAGHELPQPSVNGPAGGKEAVAAALGRWAVGGGAGR